MCPTNRDTKEWFPDLIDRAKNGLRAAGVPEQFWRYQEPIDWSREHDTKWLRFEASMWRRSYEIVSRALAYKSQPAPPWSET